MKDWCPDKMGFLPRTNLLGVGLWPHWRTNPLKGVFPLGMRFARRMDLLGRFRASGRVRSPSWDLKLFLLDLEACPLPLVGVSIVIL
jgi:hypothetical protein